MNKTLAPYTLRCNIYFVDREAFRQAMIEIGRKGGQARAENLSAAERKRIAIKASKAAASARKKKARQRRAKAAS